MCKVASIRSFADATGAEASLAHTVTGNTASICLPVFVDFLPMLIFDCLFRSLSLPAPEISSTEFEAQIQFDAVTSTSIYSRYQRSQEDDFEGDNGGFDVEHDGEEFVQHPPLDRGPYFDTSASKNVTALVGTTTYLNCRVRNLGNKTVSTGCMLRRRLMT